MPTRVFTGLLYSLWPDLEAELVGKFDWQDIVNYTVGAVLCYLLLWVWRREVSKVQVLRAAEEAAANEQRRQQQRQQRGRQQPRQQPRREKGGEHRARKRPCSLL